MKNNLSYASSKEVVNKIVRYTGAVVTGSDILVQEGFLKSSDIYNINIIVSEKRLKYVFNILRDYEYTKPEDRNIFGKAGYYPIVVKTTAVLNKKPTVDEIITNKFSIGRDIDLQKLIKVCSKRIELNSNKKEKDVQKPKS